MTASKRFSLLGNSKCIIRRMAEYRKIKKLVIILKDENQKLIDGLGLIDFGKEDKKYLTRYSLANKYSTAKNVSKGKAEALVGSAIKHEFIFVAYTKKSTIADAKGIEYIDVNPKEGYDLMQEFLQIPTGVIRASLKENSALISIVVAIVVAIATVVNVIIELDK